MLQVPSSGCRRAATTPSFGPTRFLTHTAAPHTPEGTRAAQIPAPASAYGAAVSVRQSRPFRAFQRPGAYGFCIIDYYEEVLECLGEEILPFTNMAAKVLHEAVTYNGGQPNRNLGDAFQCVWKPQACSPRRITHACGNVSTHARSTC